MLAANVGLMLVARIGSTLASNAGAILSFGYYAEVGPTLYLVSRRVLKVDVRHWSDTSPTLKSYVASILIHVS